MEDQRGAFLVGYPDLEALRDWCGLRRKKRHHPGLAESGVVGDADATIDADLGSLLPAQERFGIVQVLDDDRHARLPGAAGQAKSLRESGVAGIELEHVGGAVVAI